MYGRSEWFYERVAQEMAVPTMLVLQQLAQSNENEILLQHDDIERCGTLPKLRQKGLINFDSLEKTMFIQELNKEVTMHFSVVTLSERGKNFIKDFRSDLNRNLRDKKEEAEKVLAMSRF